MNAPAADPLVARLRAAGVEITRVSGPPAFPDSIHVAPRSWRLVQRLFPRLSVEELTLPCGQPARQIVTSDGVLIRARGSDGSDIVRRMQQHQQRVSNVLTILLCRDIRVTGWDVQMEADPPVVVYVHSDDWDSAQALFGERAQQRVLVPGPTEEPEVWLAVGVRP